MTIATGITNDQGNMQKFRKKLNTCFADNGMFSERITSCTHEQEERRIGQRLYRLQNGT